ncbi:MAG: hypothetical protein GYB68_04920 [Chloroflexi bacterium]|nr:hypothetical protein [Chloroflexota bacterium]
MNAEDLTDVENVILQLTGDHPRLLFVLSGPSGAGKNSIIKNLLDNHVNEMDRVTTYTTREKRDGEVDGDQYYFVSLERFRELARAGKLMEAEGHDVYQSGHQYSMPSDLFEGVDDDKPLVVAEVDIHGMRRIRDRFPLVITIFVTAPPGSLMKRIRERDADLPDDEFANRIRTAHDQIQAAKEFDYVVYNKEGQFERTIAAIEAIIWAERLKVRPGFDLEAIFPASAFAIPETE